MLNTFHTIFMSTCEEVSAENSLEMEMWMLNFEQKVSIDAEDSLVWYAYDIVLSTINGYFSFIEAVNLEQTLTVQ